MALTSSQAIHEQQAAQALDTLDTLVSRAPAISVQLGISPAAVMEDVALARAALAATVS